MSVWNEAYEKFDMQIWKTVGARFNAHRRLSWKQNMSVFTIAMLSIYNLAITLLPLNKVLSSDLISPVSALTSVFVLIVSLLETSKGYELKAERLHNNAMKLNELYGKFKICRTLEQSPESIMDQYHALIQECPENHTPCDMDLFRAQHKKDFGLNCCAARWIKLVCILKTNFFYLVLLVSPWIISPAMRILRG